MHEQVAQWKETAKNAAPVTPVPLAEEADEIVLENSLQTDEAEPLVSQMETAPPRPLPTLPVSMKMNDVDLPVLIRTLARAADLDILINDNITGRTRMLITNVPWDQAFTSILETYGLTYEWSGDVLRVISVEDLKRKQALMEAMQDYEKSKKKYDLTIMQLARKKNRLEPLATKIVKIHYADLNSLQQNLTQYLENKEKENATDANADEGSGKTETKEPRAGIMVDEFSNSLIIHASRSDIKSIMPVIRRLDQPIKQVLIEAHIVEAESSTGKELGIQGGGLGTMSNNQGKSISIGGNMTEAGNTLSEGYDAVDGNVVNLPISSTGTGMSLGLMAQKAGEFVLYTQLLALEEEGKLNILSKPSITTLDHRKAVIKSGKEVPFQTVENDEVNISWKEAVIKLDVTPHIIDNRIIRLEIVTHKDELDFTNPVNGNPTIITKNAQTDVMLFDGQTTVIGGLNKEKVTAGEAGVPGLRKIKGLGWLFNSTEDTNEMEELLIFITPHILKNHMTPD